MIQFSGDAVDDGDDADDNDDDDVDVCAYMLLLVQLLLRFRE